MVGASTRPGSYGNQAVANLVAAGFAGPVFGVHPTAAEVHGVPCFPTIADLPLAPDALVIATPAATVPGLVAEAGAYGCGGAVVLAAGFAEVAGGRALQDELVTAARRYGLPVCGPNGNGIVSVTHRAPLWGDAYTPRRPGPVALVSQSGNVAVNALLSTRALGLHTVVSCGNQAVLDAADYLSALAELDGVRSVALYLEDEGDGERLAVALADCAEQGIRVAVLKAGSSVLGAAAAAAHTGSVAGDARVSRALVEEAGGAWARNPHELLELAKTLAIRRPSRAPGVLVVTCSGGDAATAADEAERLGVPLPALAPGTERALGGVLPATATPGNPLDYTAVIFGEVERTAELITIAAQDAAVGPVLVYYDRPARMSEEAAESWDGALDGIILAASRLDQPVLVASTLPELMPEATAEQLAAHGVVPVAGLSEGLLCAGALLGPVPDPVRLKDIAAAAGRLESGGWLAEHRAKELLAGRGIPVPRGRVVADPEDAVRAVGEFGGNIAIKASSEGIQHKSRIGALVLGADADQARAAFPRLRAFGEVLAEEMVTPGVEVLVAVRRDGLVPVLVLGLGGVWVELLDDVALIPLPADAARVSRALSTLKAHPLLKSGNIGKLVELAVAVGELAMDEGLGLVELNPVFVRPDGVVAVDAVIRRGT